jgi:F-type H+-transporting ATPase subunit epsilon
MMKAFSLNIVSPEKQLYVGLASKLFITTLQGELEILYGHARLLAQLAPAPAWIVKPNGVKEAVVIFGGILEVQPNRCIILADTGIRAADLDEAKALNAKRDAERILKQKNISHLEYTAVKEELAFASAQLRVLKYLLSKQ